MIRALCIMQINVETHESIAHYCIGLSDRLTRYTCLRLASGRPYGLMALVTTP